MTGLTGPGLAPLAFVLGALTAVCLAAIVVLFWVGGLTADRIAGVLLIPVVLMLIGAVFLWSRRFDETHPVRHPVRFARARWRTHGARRPSAGASSLRQRRQRRR